MILEIDATLHDALSECPAAVRRFFEHVSSIDAFAVRVRKVQLELWFEGEKVGGFNRSKTQRWYFSKVFVASRAANSVLEAFFVLQTKRGHTWFQLNNRPGATALFEAALAVFLARDF